MRRYDGINTTKTFTSSILIKIIIHLWIIYKHTDIKYEKLILERWNNKIPRPILNN